MSSWAVILLNYRRPQNIGRIATDISTAIPQAPIFLIDQSLDNAFASRDDIPWHKVWCRRSMSNDGAGSRFALAASLPFDRFLAVDDDIFLSARQVQELCNKLHADPARPHGIWGQIVNRLDDGRLRMKGGVHRENLQVDVLNRVYAFTAQQAVNCMLMAERLGYSWPEIGPTDDLFVSFSGERRPLCHDLGDIESCSSSDDPAIAVWRRQGFQRSRYEMLERLASAVHFA